MTTTPKLSIRGDILQWARKTAALTVPEAAEKLGMEEGRLRDWEANGGDPHARQLKTIARVYGRCTDVFFMPAPPREPPSPVDFRTYFGPGFRRRLTHPTIMVLREAWQVQEIYGEMREELGTKIPVRLPHLEMPSDPEEIAARMRDFFGVTLQEQCGWRGEYQALREWRRALEGMGILVMQPKMPREELRAFSLSGETPIIALNANDFPTARIFSMFHEWVHLALGEPGLCNPDGSFVAKIRTNAVETFCNSVAGRFLLPTAALSEHPVVAEYREQRDDDLLSVLGKIAGVFNVSRAVALWRFLEMNLITRRVFDDMRSRLAKLAAAQRRTAKNRMKREKTFRPPKAAKVTVRRLGPTFVSSVIQAHESGIITYREVADYLRTKIDHLDSLNIELGTA